MYDIHEELKWSKASIKDLISQMEAAVYTKKGIDGSTHIFKDQESLWCWNSLLYDFKPWISLGYRTLYRTRKHWVVKDNGISSAIKYESFWKAFGYLLYWWFHHKTLFIRKIKIYGKLYFNIRDKPKPYMFRCDEILCNDDAIRQRVGLKTAEEFASMVAKTQEIQDEYEKREKYKDPVYYNWLKSQKHDQRYWETPGRNF